MKLLIRFVCICALAIPARNFAQQNELHWYTLKSILPMDAAEGKEALTQIRLLTTDSLSSFTDKNNTFKLATKTAVDMNAFCDVLNEEGYYIADITNGSGPSTIYHRSSQGYQQALLYTKDIALFNTLGLTEVVLKQPQYEALNDEQRIAIDTSPIFIIKEE